MKELKTVANEACQLKLENKRLRGALEDLREYFDQRADADQPSGSSPIPNEEMTLLMQIDEVLKLLDVKEVTK